MYIEKILDPKKKSPLEVDWALLELKKRDKPCNFLVLVIIIFVVQLCGFVTAWDSRYSLRLLLFFF